MPDTKLGNKGIDCPYLNSRATTRVTERCGVDVVISVRNPEWYGGKPLENLGACLGPSETLQQLLENQSGGQDGLAGAKGVGRRRNLA